MWCPVYVLTLMHAILFKEIFMLGKRGVTVVTPDANWTSLSTAIISTAIWKQVSGQRQYGCKHPTQHVMHEHMIVIRKFWRLLLLMGQTGLTDQDLYFIIFLPKLDLLGIFESKGFISTVGKVPRITTLRWNIRATETSSKDIRNSNRMIHSSYGYFEFR